MYSTHTITFYCVKGHDPKCQDNKFLSCVDFEKVGGFNKKDEESKHESEIKKARQEFEKYVLEYKKHDADMQDALRTIQNSERRIVNEFEKFADVVEAAAKTNHYYMKNLDAKITRNGLVIVMQTKFKTFKMSYFKNYIDILGFPTISFEDNSMQITWNVKGD